ncbi:MAG: HPr(Ser) kinase/phosphatase [bacterium]|nr:HPr(Ser) kinase/phosphatase [bacterium]
MDEQKKIKVWEFLKRADKLKLNIIAGEGGVEYKTLTTTEINRPGLTISGYYDFFRPERLQLFGRGESGFLNYKSPSERIEIIKKFLSFDIPAIVFTHSNTPPDEMIFLCNEKNTPLFVSQLDTKTFITKCTSLLEDMLSPSMTIHGGCIDVFGVGCLITGESGIGKSEVMLELLRRGHLLVADDVVEVIKKSEVLLAQHPTSSKLPKGFIEVRGIGIIDVTHIFGVGRVLDRTKIEILFEFSREAREERIIELEKKDFFGVNIFSSQIHVTPGRNIATLIETAVISLRTKQMGIDNRKIIDRLISQ